MVVLDMNSSACGAAALMTGQPPCPAKRPTVDSTAAPSDHTGPDHQHLEGQPYSIFGEDQGNERKACISHSHTEGQRSFVNFHVYI